LFYLSHDLDITLILAIVAQSVHDLVTPDIVEPLIYHIANNFVVDRRPPEVISIGESEFVCFYDFFSSFFLSTCICFSLSRIEHDQRDLYALAACYA
jgi:hypothetical protein